jgi:hypothetical protein
MFSILLAGAASAQTLFQEGTIVYSVRIGSAAGSEQVGAGTYTVTIKGANIRKELRMNSGFQNVILQNRNTQTAYSLQTASGQPYAIQLRLEDLMAQRKPYEDFKMTDEAGVMTQAGRNCQKATVTYKDGTQSSICYSTEWLSPDQLLFDRFPGISNIPLSFEYRNEAGVTMYFTVEKIETKAVESSIFRVPPQYKIISNSEYKSLHK